MTALAELMTAREFGELVSGNCPRCGGGVGCPCTHCQACKRPHSECICGWDSVDVLSPLPDDVVTEPWSWARVTGATATATVLFVWAFALGAMYLAEWRGAT